MTELSHLPESRPKAIYLEFGDYDDPRLILPVAFGAEGLQYHCVRPGSELERLPVNLAWTVMIDDLAIGASGPGSFTADTLQWLFADAYRITLDATERHIPLYTHVVAERVIGTRILVIQTVESRRLVWRRFARENCEWYGTLELVPFLDNPDQHVLPLMTRFEERAEPRR
jgi:hypothetical protein